MQKNNKTLILQSLSTVLTVMFVTKEGRNVLCKVICGLTVAWILSLFGFAEMTIDMFHQFGLEITTSTYYMLFAILGILTIHFED